MDFRTYSATQNVLNHYYHFFPHFFRIVYVSRRDFGRGGRGLMGGSVVSM